MLLGLNPKLCWIIEGEMQMHALRSIVFHKSRGRFVAKDVKSGLTLTVGNRYSFVTYVCTKVEAQRHKLFV